MNKSLMVISCAVALILCGCGDNESVVVDSEVEFIVSGKSDIESQGLELGLNKRNGEIVCSGCAVFDTGKYLIDDIRMASLADALSSAAEILNSLVDSEVPLTNNKSSDDYSVSFSFDCPFGEIRVRGEKRLDSCSDSMTTKIFLLHNGKSVCNYTLMEVGEKVKLEFHRSIDVQRLLGSFNKEGTSVDVVLEKAKVHNIASLGNVKGLDAAVRYNKMSGGEMEWESVVVVKVPKRKS